jgi:ACR3 family arsenite transporter
VPDVKRLSKHMKDFLLLYSIIALVAGLIVGYNYRSFFKTHQALVKDLILLFAILTIYPSMVQLRTEKLGEAARNARGVIVGLSMVFLVAPLLAMVFAKLIHFKQVAMGFFVVNIVPASSASLGYVLLAEGNIELATVLAVLSLLGAFAAIPAYMHLYASMAAVKIPVGKVVASLVYTLLIPLVAGQLTRYLIIHRRAARILENHEPYLGRMKCLEALSRRVEGLSLREVTRELRVVKACIVRSLEQSVKPHLSLSTMITMLILIALLVANKAGMLVSKPLLALEIIALQAIMLAALLGLATLLDRLLGMSYEDHAAIAFISATKNASVAAAIALMALGPAAAVPAALVPVVQAPVAIAYLQALPKLRGLFQPARRRVSVGVEAAAGQGTAKMRESSV